MTRPMDENISNGHKLSPAELNGNAEVTPVSKVRQAFPQLCAVSAKNILLVTFGCTLGFSTILIPELQKSEPEIVASLEQVSWISSINLILVPLGCLISGPISQNLGRRKTMMLANIPFLAAWLLFRYATDVNMLFCALGLSGLTGGLLEAPVLTYVAEITQPSLRGLLSATSTLSIIIGVFTQLLGGRLVSWRTVALMNTALPVMCFTALCMVPESPHWLIGKGRLREAERSLCWLRGWVTPPHVREEFRYLCESIKQPKTKDPKTETGAKTDWRQYVKRSCCAPFSRVSVDSKARTGLGTHWRQYIKRTFYVPFFLVCMAFLIAAFGGMHTLQTFAVRIFGTLEAPIDKYTAAVFLGVAELLGTASCVTLIHFAGKRKLSFVSTIGTGLCFFLTAVYKYLIDHNDIDGKNYSWVPTTFLLGAAFLSHLGIRLLPWILIGEVFPGKIRSGASGAAGSVGYVFNFIVNKVFLYMERGLTLAGTFWFYSAVSFLGTVFLYFALPETEGRTLKDIEEHFSGANDLKNRPRKEEIAFKEKCAATNPIPVNDDIESKL